MKTLQISSVPMLELAQEAHEALVTQLTSRLPMTYNAKERAKMIAKRQKATDMVNHIISVINENKSDASNPKS